MRTVAEALAAERTARRTIVVAYVLVDRRRHGQLSATMRALRDAGATMVELGFPFSDPIADGPEIQEASADSLRAGTDWADLLRDARVTSRELPTAVMTYSNPVWSRGLIRAAREFRRAGVSALIVPDLPVDEARPWIRALDREGIALVLFLAPGTPLDRVGKIARTGRAFLYLVSRRGVTGEGPREQLSELERLVQEAHRIRPRLPVLVGFGVRDRPSARRALLSGADGVIVGSALVRRLRRFPRPHSAVRFLRTISRLPLSPRR